MASFENRARRQLCHEKCCRILARNCYPIGGNGRVDGGREEKGGGITREKDHLLTEPGFEKQCDSVQLLYTAHLGYRAERVRDG